jgi:transcriptional regulator with XRE-family HTH domain
MTGLAVAEKLGISAPAYRRYERDEVVPPATIIVQLADIYGIPTDAILRGGGRVPAGPGSAETIEVDLGEGQTIRIKVNARTRLAGSRDDC